MISIDVCAYMLNWDHEVHPPSSTQAVLSLMTRGLDLDMSFSSTRGTIEIRWKHIMSELDSRPTSLVFCRIFGL